MNEKQKAFMKEWKAGEKARLKSNAKLDYHMYRMNVILLSRMQNPDFPERKYLFSQAEIDDVKRRIREYEEK